MLAPHPDDESLAAGGLLQRARQAGAAVRVVYLTNGENNPWAQRASERRLFLSAADRARFGRRRQAEALAALDSLGIGGASAVFLGFPDQGLTGLLLRGDARVRAALEENAFAWRPTVVVVPSLADLHPDHSALAVLARLAAGGEAGSPGVPCAVELAYVVHHAVLRQHATHSLALPLGAEERRRKLEAIACHTTQLHWRGPWLRSFAAADECFLATSWPAILRAPIRVATARGGELELSVHAPPRVRASGRKVLNLIAAGDASRPGALAIELPLWSGSLRVRDGATGTALAAASFAGGPWSATVRLSASLLPGGGRVFAKLEHSFGFFDFAGWVPLDLPRR